MYSNCCCSCSFEAEIIKIGQSSHKMYSNNRLNFHESTTMLNAHTKKVCKLIVCTSYIYIYIYIYTYWQHFFINTNFVEYNRHFLSTYFLVDPFMLTYCFYSIRRELIDISSIIVYFPNTFCPTLGHHQGKMHYKSDVTFVCTLLLYKRKSIWAVTVCSVYF